MTLDLQQHAHRRFNPLTGRWVLVSPHRTARPWQGQVEPAAAPAPAYDPACYMCPGNRRANGALNPQYESTYVFDNDFPALSLEAPAGTHAVEDLIVAQGARGVCRVLCYSPRHDLTLARMDVQSIVQVVNCWAAQCAALAARPEIAYVQIFENRGAMMGASNPHPHGQLWATSFIPDEIAVEREEQRRYAQRHTADLLGDYLALEERLGERLVARNSHFACVVPFWATWPFETLIIARQAAQSLEHLSADERRSLAEMLGDVTRAYDRVFDTPFPYSMGLHLWPEPTFRLHVHFYPPLLRSATVRKFMVGFELLAMPQRDVTPESAAARLRDLQAGD
jgi:UDPglucose--hexose-1-phosphate uridylyltransferase